MTTVTRFSRQNDAGLRALNVFLRENLVLVVVLVLESEGPYSYCLYGSENKRFSNCPRFGVPGYCLIKSFSLPFESPEKFIS